MTCEQPPLIHIIQCIVCKIIVLSPITPQTIWFPDPSISGAPLRTKQWWATCGELSGHRKEVMCESGSYIQYNS